MAKKTKKSNKPLSVAVNIEELKADINKLKEATTNDQINEISDKYRTAVIEMQKNKDEAKKKSESKEKEKKVKKYKYPFLMYFGHDYRDVSGMFEDGKSYTENEITQVLIEHGFKEFKFANTIEYEYFQDENCLFPKLKLGNRG